MKPNDLPVPSQAMDPFEDILRKSGVSERYLAMARRRSEFSGEDIATSLRKLGLSSSELLARAISESTTLSYMSFVEVMTNDYKSVSGIPCKNPLTGLPLRFEDNTLVLAVPSPAAEIDPDYLSYETRLVIASTRSLSHVFRRVFAGTEQHYRSLSAQQMRVERGEKSDADELDDTSVIPKMFVALLRHAGYMGASDVQFSMAGEEGNIRIVVDGTGRNLDLVSRSTLEKLIITAMRCTDRNEDHIKKEIFGDATFVESGLSSELLRRELGDLRREFDFRLNFGNEHNGGTLTIRLLTRDSESQEFEQLGFDLEDRERILKATRANSGLVIVTGPTGSSKTTTVFSMLNRIDPIERSIQSIENPVEYTHPLWLQYDLRRGASGTSEDHGMELALRGMLRNNPNVISIAEVRSPATVKTMMRAAATGHLVFTTLHADSATMAVYMLRKYESLDDDIASNLQLVIGVRLIRVLCQSCRLPENRPAMFEAISELAAEAEQAPPPNSSVFRHNPAGCPVCTEGYRGRMLVYEIMENGQEVAAAIRKGASVAEIREKGIRPLKSLRGRGFMAIRDGKSSVDEVLRMIPHRRY